MTDPWSREADYQLADGIMSFLLQNKLLTTPEYKQCIRKIRKEICPPVTLLTSNQEALKTRK